MLDITLQAFVKLSMLQHVFPHVFMHLLHMSASGSSMCGTLGDSAVMHGLQKTPRLHNWALPYFAVYDAHLFA